MFFFFKKEKLVVDAFVPKKHSHAYHYAPIDYAENFYPDWWRKLPKLEVDPEKFNSDDIKNLNMRLCRGIIDHYKRGFILPMWSDLSIRTISTTSYNYAFSDSSSECAFHPVSQRIGFYEDHINIKIFSPWVLESKKDVYFSVMPAFWNTSSDPNYKVAIGTLDFFYQKALNINLLIKPPQEIFIPFKRPLLHVIPSSEKELVIKTHLIDDDEWYHKNSSRVSFYGAYSKMKKTLEEKEKSKCPFHNMKMW